MVRSPNILWLMTDEQRCDSLGCYGSPWARTPNIDALAREGVVCERAVTPAPVCAPARTSVLAAAYPSRTGVWYNVPDLDRPVPNVMGRFREAGYRTASFGKQHYIGAGTAFEREAGPILSDHVGYYRYGDGYDESLYDVLKYPGAIYNWIFGGRFPADVSETPEARVVDQAMDWLDARPAGEPFFLRVSFNGPHTPVAVPAPFDTAIDPDAIDLPGAAEGLPPGCSRWIAEDLAKCSAASALSHEQIRQMRRYYYGQVAFLDSQFGKLLDWMRARGLLDNTIVAYWADHGTHLGDYGLVQKQTFFEPAVNVPFIFWYPSRIAQGARVRTPVETQSLLPTLMDLAGIDPPEDADSPSLAQALAAGAEPDARPVFSEFTLQSFAPNVTHAGRLVMVREGDWKLSVCLDPEVHDAALYNLADDPYERRNLAGVPAHQGKYTELLALIEAHIGEQNVCRA